MSASASVTSYPLRLAAPLAVFMVLFFAAPLLMLLFISGYADNGMTQWGSLQAWAKMFDAFGLGVLGDTLWLGVQTTVLTLVMGYALAWTFVRLPPQLQPIVIFLILLPLLTSVVVRTFAWIVILGRQGIINSDAAVARLDRGSRSSCSTRPRPSWWRWRNVQMPLMVLPLITALQRIDPNLADAQRARSAQAAWRTFQARDAAAVDAWGGRRLPAHLCGRDHRVHHADLGGRRPDAVHADVHVPAVLVQA
jgi:putative spermidine/putrescine transport system permease protein